MICDLLSKYGLCALVGKDFRAAEVNGCEVVAFVSHVFEIARIERARDGEFGHFGVGKAGREFASHILHHHSLHL